MARAKTKAKSRPRKKNSTRVRRVRGEDPVLTEKAFKEWSEEFCIEIPAAKDRLFRAVCKLSLVAMKKKEKPPTIKEIKDEASIHGTNIFKYASDLIDEGLLQIAGSNSERRYAPTKQGFLQYQEWLEHQQD